MRLDPNPIHRKEIVPWYDSEAAGLTMVVLMVTVAVFGAVGVSVIRQVPEYRPLAWVPLTVVILSGTVAVSTVVRLTRRYLRRRAD